MVADEVSFANFAKIFLFAIAIEAIFLGAVLD